MGVIADDRPSIEIEPPMAPDLRRLWDLAEAKFEATTGTAPMTRDDWNRVTQDYHALVTKPRGSLAQIITERCEKAPGGD